MVQAKLGSDRRKAEDLGGTIGLEDVVTAGPGNSCPLDFICRRIVGDYGSPPACMASRGIK